MPSSPMLLTAETFPDIATTVIGTDNTVEYSTYRTQSAKITVKGSHNRIHIGENANLERLNIEINSSHNTLIIGPHVRMRGLIQLRDGDRNSVEIGSHTVSGTLNIYCAEGSRVTIGRNCMFSAVITMRTGDGHSLFDSLTGDRINPAQDITVEEHVWMGMNVTVMKDVVIGRDSMVAAHALVTSGQYPPNSLLGGLPAKVIRENVYWDHRLTDHLSNLPKLVSLADKLNHVSTTT